ncbi:hypothetical protein DV736_g1566, partial [Chaetothyriales sp. CBS 134916]
MAPWPKFGFVKWRHPSANAHQSNSDNFLATRLGLYNARQALLLNITNKHATRHPEDDFHLRLHRARSVDLTNDELVEVRAAQRTFEGAYVRTSLSQFSFALVVLKIFTSEFYSIGALYAAYGSAVLLVGAYRRQQGNRQFFTEQTHGADHPEDHGSAGQVIGKKMFRTSGNVVIVLTALSLAAYVSLLVLTFRLV